MNNVRLGIIGMGNMGSYHAAYLTNPASGTSNVTLTAICDADPVKLKNALGKYGKLQEFTSHKELLASKTCDAVVIAVPHYDHVPMTLEGFATGHHVLVEKPMAVSIRAARLASDAYPNYPHLKFGIMFNQRSNPMYQKMRELIAEGELGEVSRISWIVTNWFRTSAYFASGGWRATWKGEGGGVLINQCPHNLDLVQWITGMMPSRVTAVGFVGKTHPIEVDDEISAILEYPNGAIGHFVTSTGEYPGTNRLEICGSRGKLIAENNKLSFSKVRLDVQEYSRTTTAAFGTPEVWQVEVPFTTRTTPEHQYVLQDFINVVANNLPNEKLLSPGPDGVKGLELGNAMMMAGLTRKSIELPLDGAEYDAFIEEMIKKYGGRKNLLTKSAVSDVKGSFSGT